jgi:outer membrane beta-barrel protein
MHSFFDSGQHRTALVSLILIALAAPAFAEEDEQVLVSGAPLKNSNVAVHVVQEKALPLESRGEVALFPVVPQVNGKFTDHLGTSLSLLWHVRENFSLSLSGGYNWYSAEARFNQELVDKTQTQAQAATSLLLVFNAMAGIEVAPLYGKFAFFENSLVTFDFVVNGAFGFGGTRHQLKGQTVTAAGSLSAPSYGDTGLRLMGSIGAGFRVHIAQRFSVRLEVRDIVYTARVERVNGCTASDLTAMNTIASMATGERDPRAATVSSGCNKDSFSGEDDAREPKSRALPLALNLVRNPTSDVLNNIGVYLGASFVF